MYRRRIPYRLRSSISVRKKSLTSACRRSLSSTGKTVERFRATCNLPEPAESAEAAEAAEAAEVAQEPVEAAEVVAAAAVFRGDLAASARLERRSNCVDRCKSSWPGRSGSTRAMESCLQRR